MMFESVAVPYPMLPALRTFATGMKQTDLGQAR